MVAPGNLPLIPCPRESSSGWEAKPGTAFARRAEAALTRDYYLVEDADGHRFWLFREGLYGRETTAARWFVHGLFA